MRRLSTAGLFLVFAAGLTKASDTPERSDPTLKDLARVRAVTALTTDCSKPETFELLSGGAGTTKQLVNRDIFSHFSANLSFADQDRFNLGNGFFTKVWV